MNQESDRFFFQRPEGHGEAVATPGICQYHVATVPGRELGLFRQASQPAPMSRHLPPWQSFLQTALYHI
jgi:hypothetical protein